MEKCPLGEHSKFQALLDKLCESDEKQWDQIGKSVTKGTIWSGITILVVILMAVIGFLWHNQTSNRNEILSETKSIATAISGKDGLSERLSVIGTQLGDHLMTTPNPGHKKEDIHGRRPGEISKGNSPDLGKK